MNSNATSRHKRRQSGNTSKFGRHRKNGGLGSSDPKLIKFDYFQTKCIFAVDQCNWFCYPHL